MSPASGAITPTDAPKAARPVAANGRLVAPGQVHWPVWLDWPVWPVWAGGLALALAAVLVFWATPLWQARQDQADQAAQQWARQARQAAARPRPLAWPDPAASLAQSLPAAGAAPARLAALLALAQRHGLVVDASRQASAEWAGSGRIQRVALTLTLRGSYLALRGFVAGALQQDEALVLDQLQLGRPQPASPELTAELRWSWLQQPPGDDPPAPAQAAEVRP